MTPLHIREYVPHQVDRTALLARLGNALRAAPEVRHGRRSAMTRHTPDSLITESYLRSVSTRDMGSVTQALLGKRVATRRSAA